MEHIKFRTHHRFHPSGLIIKGILVGAGSCATCPHFAPISTIRNLSECRYSPGVWLERSSAGRSFRASLLQATARLLLRYSPRAPCPVLLPHAQDRPVSLPLRAQLALPQMRPYLHRSLIVLFPLTVFLLLHPHKPLLVAPPAILPLFARSLSYFHCATSTDTMASRKKSTTKVWVEVEV